jgi:hypothetical protein
MTVLAHTLIVGALIAGLIALRIATDRWVLRARLRDAGRGNDCSGPDCGNPCSVSGAASNHSSVTELNTQKRSADRAP